MAVPLGRQAKERGIEVEEKVDGEETRIEEQARFPQGLRALAKETDGKRVPLDEKARVTLVNCSLSVCHVRLPDPAYTPTDGKFKEEPVEIKPGGSQEMAVRDARRILKCQEVPGGDSQLVVAPPPGDCGGKVGFNAFEKRWDSCYFSDCAFHGKMAGPARFSVWQAQHRIGRLASELAIRRFMETFDSRPLVLLWGLEVIGQRTQARQRRMGLVVSRRAEDIVF